MFQELKKWVEHFVEKDSRLSTSEPASALFLDESVSPRILVVCNQKGGCGKTTTVINIGAFLASQGKKVLVIDLDTQGHASLGLGVDVEKMNWSIHDVLINNVDLNRVIVPTYVKNLFVCPANHMLSGAQLQLANLMARESILKNALQKLYQSQPYDYCLIDTSPTLNLITLNGLVAASHVLIPIQTHYYALEGMKELFYTIDVVRERLNPSLEIAGILPTIFDSRIKSNRDILAQLNEYFKGLMFKSVIHYSSKLVEAPLYRNPIAIYAPDSKSAKEYGDVTQEVVENLAKGRAHGIRS